MGVDKKQKVEMKSDSLFAKIEVRLTKVDHANRKLTGTFKFVVTDDGGAVLKTWFLDLNSVKLSESDDAAECTLTVSDDVLSSIELQKLTIKDAIAQGKLKVDGAQSERAVLLDLFIASL